MTTSTHAEYILMLASAMRLLQTPAGWMVANGQRHWPVPTLAVDLLIERRLIERIGEQADGTLWSVTSAGWAALREMSR